MPMDSSQKLEISRVIKVVRLALSESSGLDWETLPQCTRWEKSDGEGFLVSTLGPSTPVHTHAPTDTHTLNVHVKTNRKELV